MLNGKLTMPKNFPLVVRKALGTEDAYDLWRSRVVAFINYLAALMEPWKMLLAEPETDVPSLRKVGYINLVGAGLVLIGVAAHRALADPKGDWRAVADRLAGMDWRKSAKVWKPIMTFEPRGVGLRISKDAKLLRQVLKSIDFFES